MSSNNLEIVTTIRRLSANFNHNFLPFFAMRINHVTINVISNEMRGFMSRRVRNVSIAISVQHIIVECDFVISRNRVTCTATFQPEADGGKPERCTID